MAQIIEHEKERDPDAWRLADRQRIEQALIAYCVHLDRMDLEALAAHFTDDCSVDYGDGPHLKSQGADGLVKSLARMWRWKRTSHHLSNILIEFDGFDSAKTTSYVHAWHQREDGSTATILGRYLDRFERRSGRWLIHRRRMEMNGCDPGFTVPIHAFDRLPPPLGWVAPQLDRPSQEGIKPERSHD